MNQKSDEAEIRRYFHEVVNPQFLALLAKLVKNRPEDILTFCVNYFHDSGQDESQLADVINDSQFAEIRSLRLRNTKRLRCGLSSGNSRENQRKGIGVWSNSEKKPLTEMKILFCFTNSFLFSSFQESDRKLLIKKMTIQHVAAKEVVIREGEYQNCMYFVESGSFECTKRGKNEEEVFLCEFKPGQMFGELALLHNFARSATVTAKTEGTLYSLNHNHYRDTKRLAVVKKRELYLDVISKVNLFKRMDTEDLQKICDSLVEISVEAGRFVIMEGDTGERFYIVLKGILAAKKSSEQGSYPLFKEGDSFGEVALAKNEPRQASIFAVTDAVLIYLNRDVFQRVVNKEKLETDILQKYSKNTVIHTRKKR